MINWRLQRLVRLNRCRRRRNGKMAKLMAMEDEADLAPQSLIFCVVQKQ